MSASAATSSTVGRVASSEKPRTKSAIACTRSPRSKAVVLAAALVIGCILHADVELGSLAPARDHIGFVVEPKSAALVQHLAGGVEIAAVRHHVAEPVILDLRHIDRGVPGREQR